MKTIMKTLERQNQTCIVQKSIYTEVAINNPLSLQHEKLAFIPEYLSYDLRLDK